MRSLKRKSESPLSNPYAILFFQLLKGIAELQIMFNKVAAFGLKPVDFIFDDQGIDGT